MTESDKVSRKARILPKNKEIGVKMKKDLNLRGGDGSNESYGIGSYIDSVVHRS